MKNIDLEQIGYYLYMQQQEEARAQQEESNDDSNNDLVGVCTSPKPQTTENNQRPDIYPLYLPAIKSLYVYTAAAEYM